MKKENNLVKISGGLAIMFSVFLLLSVITQINKNRTLYADFLRGSKENPANVSTNINLLNNPADDSILKGKFGIDSAGDNVLEKDKMKYHYKKITSEKFENPELKPILKVEVNDNGHIGWKKIPWTWIDNQEKSLYFEFAREENGQLILNQNFTGNYQIIF